jgi:signal transduction histidine kinase
MQTLRVLIVDDEAGIRHSIARGLRGFAVSLPDLGVEARFEVDVAESGEAALERLEAEPFDVVLLDYKMEGMSGLKVLDRLQAMPGDRMVIMVTAFATIETAVRATKSGAFDFLTKPFTPAELRDTVRKATQHLLTRRRARKLEDERRRIRFDFIRVLGHELKAPLGAIENYLNLMASRALGDDVNSYSEMIERCGARAEGMRKLIGDLLDLTRIESGQKRRSLTRFNATEIARAAVDAVALEAESRGITLQVDAPSPLDVIADRGELEIILNNLVSNAVKYNRDGGRVDVRLDADDQQLRIEVSDTGIGLSQEDAAKLFNDFVRIRNKTTSHIVGSGLGLSIVKKIAAMYGGTVSVASEEGRGSTFSVVLERWSELPESDAGETGGETTFSASAQDELAVR